MTATTPPGLLARRTGLSDREVAEHLCVALVGVVWLLVVTPQGGGLHHATTALLTAVMVPALVLVRPHSRMPNVVLLLVPAMAAGALLVLATTGPGWVQADSVGTQLAGWLALIVVGAYARTPARRRAVAVAVVAAIGLQAWPAWLAWWGTKDPNSLVVGTFFWHNQVATWMAACGSVALALAATTSSRRVRAGTVLLAVVASCGVVLSTSRTTLALWLVAIVVALPIALTGPQRWRGLGAVVAVPVLTVPALLLLTSPALFPEREWAGPPVLAASDPVPDQTLTSPVGARDASSLDDNGSDRLEWTRAALAAWTERPLTGHGFGSFADTSDPRLTDDTARSPWVHNGPAEALTSGGLLFGGPVVALSLLLLTRSAAVLWRAARRVPDPERGLRTGAALATGLLLGHTLVDFDWHYSSLTVLLGVVGGLVLADGGERKAGGALTTVGLALTALLATAATLVERAF